MQGFNMGRYVPPDQEGIQSGNQIHRKKPPGHHGDTLTVRFEMPFNIFCLSCNGHIAQGVRFNAEKTRVGQYFTTPIWGFRMKHNVCGGRIVIHTDPKNTAYVVVEGAKKQDTGEDEPGGVIRVKPPPGEEDKERDGVMAKLEKAAEEAKRKAVDEPRIEELRRLSERQWADPYEHSKKMRKIFRAERNRLNAQAAGAAAIQDRLGLSIPLLEESKEDEILAKAVEFEPEVGGEGERIDEAIGGPMFRIPGGATGGTNQTAGGGGGISGVEAAREHSRRSRGERWDVGGGNAGSNSNTKGKRKLTKAEILAEQTRERLESKLRRNTRMRMDPFLVGSGSGITGIGAGNRDGESGGGSGGDTSGGVIGMGGGVSIRTTKTLDPPAFKLKKKRSEGGSLRCQPHQQEHQEQNSITSSEELSGATSAEEKPATRASPPPAQLQSQQQKAHALVDYGSSDDSE